MILSCCEMQISTKYPSATPQAILTGGCARRLIALLTPDSSEQRVLLTLRTPHSAAQCVLLIALLTPDGAEQCVLPAGQPPLTDIARAGLCLLIWFRCCLTSKHPPRPVRGLLCVHQCGPHGLGDQRNMRAPHAVACRYITAVPGPAGPWRAWAPDRPVLVQVERLLRRAARPAAPPPGTPSRCRRRCASAAVSPRRLRPLSRSRLPHLVLPSSAWAPLPAFLA